jgi:hypothetical protein
MTTRIKAVGTYRPRIRLGRTADRQDLVRFISRSTGLNESDILQVLTELRDAVIYHMLDVRSVNLDGLGRYFPVMGLDGTFKVGHRVDRRIRAALNVPGQFQGEIINQEYIGMTVEDLVDLWNQESPDEPIP